MALKNPSHWPNALLSALHPIRALLEEDGVTEIEVNGPSRVYVKGPGWSGHKLVEGVGWPSPESLEAACKVVAQVSSRVVNESKPLLDGRLPGGERMNIAVPPAVAVVSMTIRKFPVETMTLDKLEGYGSISPALRMMLEGLVLARKNLLVSGGTESGKTSLLNALSRVIPTRERIVTLEDAQELQIQQPNWVPMLTVEAWKPEGENVPMGRLVKNALRQTPDRIIVGEVRDEAALYMLRTFSTGHSGGFSTVHANSAPDALDQIQLLAQFAAEAGTVSAGTMARLVARAIEVVAHVRRYDEDGSRRVEEIIEVEGLRFNGSEAEFVTRSLAKYEVMGVEEREGERPRLLGEWRFPQEPSAALRKVLKFKGIPWPEVEGAWLSE